MDSQLKGFILNHTLKSYTITPIESNNVLVVTMKFYGGYKYKSPSKRRWDRLRKERFLAKFKRDPLLVPIPFLEPDQSPSPVALGGLVCSAIATAFMTQAEEMLEDMKDLCHQWDCLAQEAGRAEKEWEKMCKQVQDLRSVVRGELESLEQELKSKKDELAQLEARKEMLEASGFAPRASVRAPGMSMGASAEPSAPKKKKKKKQKRHPGLPSQEGQEYYKSYLVHL